MKKKTARILVISIAVLVVLYLVFRKQINEQFEKALGAKVDKIQWTSTLPTTDPKVKPQGQDTDPVVKNSRR